MRALHFRFGQTLHEDPMLELIELKQTRIVQEFLVQFDALLDEVELSEGIFYHLFFERTETRDWCSSQNVGTKNLDEGL